LGKGQKSRIKHILGSTATDTDDITLTTKLDRDYFKVVESESTDEMSSGSDEFSLSNESGAESNSDLSGEISYGESSGEEKFLAQSGGEESHGELSGQEFQAEISGEEVEPMTIE
jgi:hypothetical protein